MLAIRPPTEIWAISRPLPRELSQLSALNSLMLHSTVWAYQGPQGLLLMPQVGRIRCHFL